MALEIYKNGGGSDRVKEYLLNNPEADVNEKGKKEKEDGMSGWTILHVACYYDDRDMVSFLLSHPYIAVNCEDDHMETPLSLACHRNSYSCIILLLKDRRVDVSVGGPDTRNIMFEMALAGRQEVLQFLIASGKEVDIGTPEFPENDATVAADHGGCPEIKKMLQEFREDPERVRLKSRKDTGWNDLQAAEWFALIIFFCDGLVRFRKTKRKITKHHINLSDTKEPDNPGTRFFKIVARLPIELQMIVCFRLSGSMKENIPGNDREEAYRDLIRSLQNDDFFLFKALIHDLTFESVFLFATS